MDDSKSSFVLELIQYDIIKFGTFTLKSGDTSPFYIDLRLIPCYPELFRKAISFLDTTLMNSGLRYHHLAGLISAGIPFATGLVLKENKSLLQIRSNVKDHGRKKVIEGSYKSQDDVVIVDDLISTGASKIPAIQRLREKDLKVNGILVIIDRRKKHDLGKSLEDVPVYSVITLDDIVSTVTANKDGIAIEDIDEFLSSIEKWYT